MLKTIRVEISPTTAGSFAYAFFGDDRCVFTGLDDACMLSSINHAEYIAKAIAAQEGKEVLSIRFFDLQTQHSYKRHGTDSFEFDHVRLVEDRNLLGFSADGWRLTECPQEVIQVFSAFLSEEAGQSVPRAFEEQF